MIMFWFFSLAMIIIALIFLIRPLRFGMDQIDIDRTAQNVAITKERLNELEVDLEQSVINQTEYNQTKEELEQALLNDVEQEKPKNTIQVDNQPYNRIARFILIFSVPAFAISIYAYLGQPELIEGNKKQTMEAVHASSNGAKNLNLGSVEEMVEKLAAKLKDNPKNAEGWFLLARSYMTMKRYKEAVAALEKTNSLVPNNPVVMLRYADALTMLRGGQISGKPFDLIKKAVAMKPDDPTGLWLIGMGYDEQGEYQKAISYWNLLIPLLKDEQSINEVQNLIRQAKRKAGMSFSQNTTVTNTVAEKKPIKSLTVKVSIDKKLLKIVSANDTVFIFAKAINGPPMPLAVVRKQVKDLPLEVVLDDNMAMIPAMKLSSFERIKIIARLSKSGSVKTQSGDIQSEVYITSPRKKEKVVLIINKFLP